MADPPVVWWTSRRWVAAVLLASAALAAAACEAFAPTGRRRLTGWLAALVLGGIGAVWLRWGPAGVRTTVGVDPGVDRPADGGQGGPDGDAEALEALRRENAELRAAATAMAAAAPPPGVPPLPGAGLPGLPGGIPPPPPELAGSGGMDAYRSFVTGAPTSGAFTGFGAAVGAPGEPAPSQGYGWTSAPGQWQPSAGALGPTGPMGHLGPSPAAPAAGMWGPTGAGMAASQPAGLLKVTGSPAAETVKQYLMACHSAARADPHWGQRFWQAVAELEARGALDATLLALLRAHGYIGVGTRTAPRPEALKQGLEALATVTLPPVGGGGFAAPEDDPARWGQALAADFQRAGPEIYRSMRAEGASSTREWLNQRYSGSRTSPVWVDLWTMASTVDFGLRGLRSEQEVLARLGTDDQLEIALRRLAAYVYEQRTGDRTGAQHMLGVVPPGASVDVAPDWLVKDATAHSKAEHQRSEYLRKRKPKGGGKDGEKDGPKGKGDRGRGRGGQGE